MFNSCFSIAPIFVILIFRVPIERWVTLPKRVGRHVKFCAFGDFGWLERRLMMKLRRLGGRGWQLKWKLKVNAWDWNVLKMPYDVAIEHKPEGVKCNLPLQIIYLRVILSYILFYNTKWLNVRSRKKCARENLSKNIDTCYLCEQSNFCTRRKKMIEFITGRKRKWWESYGNFVNFLLLKEVITCFP